MENNELDLVEFLDENDNKVVMEVLDYFFYEGEEYATLTEYNEEKCAACTAGDCAGCGADEVVIMKIVPVGEDEEEFEPVEPALAQKLLDLLNSGAFEGDEDEDDE